MQDRIPEGVRTDAQGEGGDHHKRGGWLTPQRPQDQLQITSAEPDHTCRVVGAAEHAVSDAAQDLCDKPHAQRPAAASVCATGFDLGEEIAFDGEGILT